MKIRGHQPALKAQGFRIYHFGWGGEDDPVMLKKYEDMGFMNHYPAYWDVEHLQKLKEAGGVGWIYGHDPLYAETIDGKIVYSLKDGWREELEQNVEKLKQAGVWDAVAGFEYDEPMLTTTNNIFEQVSEEVAKYGKRQLAIFSVYELVEGSNPRSEDPEYGKEAHLIDERSCRFLTDIAFDYYGEAHYEAHKPLTDEMKRRVNRDDVYVWYVPSTWSFFNRFGQDHAVKHLETCYRLLQEETHPGGLICYNWHSFENKGESLDWLLADQNRSRWNVLEKRMIEIANEIIEKPLTNIGLED